MAHDEYQAVRERAGIVDRSGRGRLIVAGQDRGTYLHALLTNDIAAVRPGSGCYSAYLTPQGRMITDMLVFELGDLVLLDLPRVATAKVLGLLEQFVFTEDVKLGDVTASFASVGVHGPRAAEVVAAVLAAPGGAGAASPANGLAGWPEFANRRLAFGGEPVIVARVDELNLPGYLLYVDRAAAPALHGALERAGAVAIDPATFDVLRVEAARPAFGTDMDEETIPLEAGIEGQAISFTKGCYPGQEVVIRILHRGHGRIARRLAGLVVEGDVVPAAGDRIMAGDKEVGRVTSAVHSPALGRPIALGFVHRDFLAPGTSVQILHEDARLAAAVAETPFVGRPDRRGGPGGRSS